YGGTEDHDQYGQLVLSTTHQLLRYDGAFDFMVIDEVDAFPFHFDRMLRDAVDRAKKPAATAVYLTATPTNALKKRYFGKDLPGVRIPVRYHGHPLPVPFFKRCGNWKKALNRGSLPEVVFRWIMSRFERSVQAFLFVPTIEVMNQAAELFKKQIVTVAGVHSEDPRRREKIESFRAGELSILVTTTILERGVTVAGAEVAVLGSDENVFTEQALVQIAGRAGRSAAAPYGEVIYFFETKTKEMVKARRHIQSMNKEAFSKADAKS
ncbi:MAG TPA: helicase-related protein, partial [Bacillales bacterium]|nr:helicase-related protein [Bacillales bacterium]